jgi:hypothetical protein
VANERRDAEVLNDEGIGPKGDDVVERVDHVLKLSFEDEDVKGEEYLYSIKVSVLDHRSQFIEFKGRGSTSSVKARHPHVYGIGAVMNGGTKHVPIPDGGEDLWCCGLR